MSLLELLAVVTLMGIFSAAVVTRFGRDIFGDVGVRGEARKISLGLLQAQRRAIRTGDPHGLQVYGSQSNISSWSVIRVLDNGSREIVEGPIAVPSDLTIATDRSEILFDFEGNGTNSFTADLSGPNRTWKIDVTQLTGLIDCHEVP